MSSHPATHRSNTPLARHGRLFRTDSFLKNRGYYWLPKPGFVIYITGDLKTSPRRELVLLMVLRCTGGDMSSHPQLEHEIAQLIVESLHMEGITPEDIDAEAPLFNEGLGLDSIDALELSLAISMRYGFQIKSDDSDNERIFSNLRSLCQHIENHRIK